MTYTPEIIEVGITDETGDYVAKLTWIDSESIQVTVTGAITNSGDWPDLAGAIHVGIVSMETSTREFLAKEAGK